MVDPVASSTWSARSCRAASTSCQRPAWRYGAGDGRALEDSAPRPHRGLAEAGDEAAHVHLGAAPLQHSAVEGVGDHLAGEIGAVEHRDVGVDLAVDGLGVAGEAFVVAGFRGELELAGAAEGAVDALLGDDALDRLDARVEGAVQRGRLLEAEGSRACRKLWARPLLRCPPLRPEAPKPTVSASSITDAAPALASASAAPRAR